MTFRVGQKVVCVDSTSGPFDWAPGEAPTEGGIYAITRIGIGVDDTTVLEFREITRHPNTLLHWGHMGYGAYRFRPIVERKTDISIFTRLLVPGSKVSEPV